MEKGREKFIIEDHSIGFVMSRKDRKQRKSVGQKAEHCFIGLSSMVR